MLPAHEYPLWQAVQIEPFADVPGWVQDAAEAEAKRLARFLGGESALSWAG